MTDKKEVKKCIDAYPNAVSFTGKPKTGDKYLFRKSNDTDGGNQMSDQTQETTLDVAGAYGMIASIKDSLPEDFDMNAFAKALDVEDDNTEGKVQEIIKSSEGVDPKLVELVKSMSSKIDTLATQNDELKAENDATKKEEIKKSLDTVADSLELLPIKKDELSSLLYTLRVDHGDEIAEQVQEVFEKCHASLKEGIPLETAGVDTDNEEATEGGNAEAFAKAVEDAWKADTSEKSDTMKKVAAMELVKSQDEEGYKDFNDKVKAGEIKNIL